MRRWTLTLMNDTALLKGYARGNALAFEVLYKRHKNALFGFIFRQCNNRAVAEELIHDTWMAVISQASGFETKAAFKTWLFRIAHNRLIDHWRRHGANAKVLFEQLSDVHAARQSSLSESLEIDELLRNIGLLSTEQAETLLLKIEGFSHAEIADITNSKAETVKSRLRYATQRLRINAEVN